MKTSLLLFPGADGSDRNLLSPASHEGKPSPWPLPQVGLLSRQTSCQPPPGGNLAATLQKGDNLPFHSLQASCPNCQQGLPTGKLGSRPSGAGQRLGRADVLGWVVIRGCGIHTCLGERMSLSAIITRLRSPLGPVPISSYQMSPAAGWGWVWSEA
jgi:hypothetical protein